MKVPHFFHVVIPGSRVGFRRSAALAYPGPLYLTGYFIIPKPIPEIDDIITGVEVILASAVLRFQVRFTPKTLLTWPEIFF